MTKMSTQCTILSWMERASRVTFKRQGDGLEGPIMDLLQIVPYGYYVIFATRIMSSHLKFDSLRTWNDSYHWFIYLVYCSIFQWDGTSGSTHLQCNIKIGKFAYIQYNCNHQVYPINQIKPTNQQVHVQACDNKVWRLPRHVWLL